MNRPEVEQGTRGDVLARTIRVRVRVRVRVGWRHEISQNRETQVIPPPAFYCINHNQTRPLQSIEGVRVRVRVEDISAKTQASSVNPLKNSCYLVGILCLNSPTIPVFK